ncbi:Protein PHLOEM PROTEIN 2-LIKE A8 [Cardamine amara subsp. amara]|uniref:Protein PHLOEM PROTEIN 2-LIKE A8 n=1 Tax=Cardamine amara subsp. amara TaxID=228776 RepID=A0ABD1C0X7_CARAN
MVSSLPPKVNEGPQVFINFRGKELRETFISHLTSALKDMGINAYIDSDELAGHKLDKLFERIKESTVALAVLSSEYTNSNWCLKELVKIMECVDKDNLWVIPIFYKLDPTTVKKLDGDFGIQLWNLWRGGRNRDGRILKWNEALQGVAGRFGLDSKTHGNDPALVDDIITHVQNALSEDLSRRENKRRRRAIYGIIILIFISIIFVYIYRNFPHLLYCRFS